jgi:hypothetical protein
MAFKTTAANFPRRHFVVPLARNFRYSPDVRKPGKFFSICATNAGSQIEHFS